MRHTLALGFVLGLLGTATFVACSSESSNPNPNPTPDAQADAVVDAPPDVAPLLYPAGPYGLAVGLTFPDVSLTGYYAGKAPARVIAMRELWDPDAKKGLRAIHFTVQAGWCFSTCENMEKQRTQFATDGTHAYASKGVRFVTALVNGVDPKKAPTINDLDAWLVAAPSTFDLLLDPFVADAGMYPQTVWDTDGSTNTGNFTVPTNYAIDPRTMKITSVVTGFNPSDTTLAPIDALLAKNP